MPHVIEKHHDDSIQIAGQTCVITHRELRGARYKFDWHIAIEGQPEKWEADPDRNEAIRKMETRLASKD